MGLIFNRRSRAPVQEKSIDASDLLPWSGGDNDGEEIGDKYSTQATHGAERNPYVARCVELRASAVASLHPVLYDADGNEVDSDHPLKRLLRQPNPRMSWRDFIHAIESHLAINGNAYILPVVTVKGIEELWPIMPSYIEPVTRDDLFDPIVRWRTQVGMRFRYYETDEIIHIHGTVGHDGVLGISPVHTLALSITQQTEARKWNVALMENGAKPSMVITDPRPMTPAQFLDFSSRLRMKHSGSNKAGEIMVLDGDKTVNFGGFNARDMDYSQGMATMAREIAIGLGVPSPLIGDSANMTYSNLMEARQALALLTVVPEADKIYEALSSWMTPYYPEIDRIGYDKQDVDALKGDETGLITALNSCEFLSTNEKRARLSYGDVPDGDVILTVMGKVPLSESATDIDETMKQASNDS